MKCRFDSPAGTSPPQLLESSSCYAGDLQSFRMDDLFFQTSNTTQSRIARYNCPCIRNLPKVAENISGRMRGDARLWTPPTLPITLTARRSLPLTKVGNSCLPLFSPSADLHTINNYLPLQASQLCDSQALGRFGGSPHYPLPRGEHG